VTVSTVGLVVHTQRPPAVGLAHRAAAWLAERGHAAVVPPSDAEALALPAWECDGDKIRTPVAVALSIGGDGTMLRAVDLLAPHEVPVLGVNVGHLGYLTEVEPAEIEEALSRVLAGDYTIDARMTLEVEVAGGEHSGRYVVLNEAVVEKTESGHTIRLAVCINDQFFTTYATDGLIVATPTGSTAYSLSARGPIVSPRHRALLLTPVAPHMLFDRTLVLDELESISLEVIDGRGASLSLDGRNMGRLANGESITCRAGPHNARLVTFGKRDFHQILKTKFGLADR